MFRCKASIAEIEGQPGDVTKDQRRAQLRVIDGATART